MKYKKKPVIIEAFQLKDWDTFNNTHEWYATLPKWMLDALDHKVAFFKGQEKAIYINTLEGVHRADIDDYIIQGVKGELYPCKPDIFEQTYDIVED